MDQKRDCLRVLIVDDNENDAILIARALRSLANQIETERVESETEMLAALERNRWDAVLMDWVIPKFDAPAALAVLRRLNCKLPCIVVSGMPGESVAVMAIKLGAGDFVPKNALNDLPVVLGRELDLSGGQFGGTG